MMRLFNLLFLIMSLASLVVADGMKTSRSGERPNILFFFVDDMGWQDTSVPFHTKITKLNRDYHTPNMEKLSKQGLLFTNAYATAVCSPSRVSLMTGQNAARHKVTCWTLRKNVSTERGFSNLQSPKWNLNGLQPIGANISRSYEAVSLPQLLKQAGYHTIHAGKAHFGAQNTPGADPSNLGFITNIAGSYMGAPGSYHGDKNFSGKSRGRGTIWDVPGLEKYHGQKINLTEAITREAITEVEKAVTAKQPFYLYMSHYAVHSPWEADRRFIANYQGEDWSKHKSVLASMLQSMDKSLGDLQATFDRLGVADNTIIVFMSDNGSPAQCPANLPLRGHKVTGFEGGTRVPLIVKWPKVTPTNQRTNSPIIIEDIFPTFLEMAQVKHTQKVDGISFTDILKKPETNRSNRPLFWHYPNRYGQTPYSAVRLGNHKLIYWHHNEKIMLFNLKSDIGESTDLLKKEPVMANKLALILSSHLRETKADMLTKKATKQLVPYPDTVLANLQINK